MLNQQPECGRSVGYNSEQLAIWLGRADVRTALHVKGTNWKESFGRCKNGCHDMPSFDQQISGGKYISESLRRGIHVTLFYGGYDVMCDFEHAAQMALKFQWTGQTLFRDAQFRPIHVEGVQVGIQKSVMSAKTSFNIMRFDQAGHIVPLTAKVEALRALRTLLDASAEDASAEEKTLLISFNGIGASRPSYAIYFFAATILLISRFAVSSMKTIRAI